MKRILWILALTSTLLFAQQSVEIKRGKVHSSTQGYIHLSPMTGGRILEDGSDIGIDLRPQGVEKYYDKTLSKGISIQTGINEHLQTNVALEIDVKRMELRAKESFVGVMNNHTGQLIMLARSSRLDPVTIKTKEIPILKDRFADFLFEPGSLMFPVWGTVMAGKKDAKEWVKQLRKTDDFSNIAPFLSVEEMIRGLDAFGFGRSSGIDLPYDEAGSIPSLKVLEDENNRVALLSGYGMKVTFMQMLKAYSAFSAKGVLLTPHIASATIEGNTTKKLSFPSSRAFSKMLSSNVKYALVNEAKRRDDILLMDSIDIGGAYGEGDLPSDDNITEEAYSAYFGFAESLLGQSYSIGVFLIYEKKGKSKNVPSPMPIFNLVVDEMVKKSFL